MKPAIRFLSICAALFGILLAPATVAGADSDAEEILRGFVEDFANEMLSPEQETAFKAHLNEMKKSITHSEIDSGAVYDKQPGRDIRSDLDQLCSRVQTRAQR